MNKNVSLGLLVLSLMGIGFTFQMAEDTMNRDIDWMMEANLLDYVNPIAIAFCGCAFAISLGSLLYQQRKLKLQQTQA